MLLSARINAADDKRRIKARAPEVWNRAQGLALVAWIFSDKYKELKVRFVPIVIWPLRITTVLVTLPVVLLLVALVRAVIGV
jgi:hypothetical protein